jgi:hypothetical protein
LVKGSPRQGYTDLTIAGCRHPPELSKLPLLIVALTSVPLPDLKGAGELVGEIEVIEVLDNSYRRNTFLMGVRDGTLKRQIALRIRSADQQKCIRNFT